MTQAGGGFGRRHQHDYVVQAVRLSKAVGAPVQVVWTRDDDLRHDFYRPATYNVLRAGLDADGQPDRLDAPHRRARHRHLHGLRRAGQARLELDRGRREPALRHPRPRGGPAHPGRPGRSRWAGGARSASSQNAYVTECFLDEIAAAAGRDPYELRRALLAKQPRAPRRARPGRARRRAGARPCPPGRPAASPCTPASSRSSRRWPRWRSATAAPCACGASSARWTAAPSCTPTWCASRWRAASSTA